MLLSESEKEDLISALQDDVNDIQKKSDELKVWHAVCFVSFG